MKGNYKFLSVIWEKWKQSVCSITIPGSRTFYSLFIPFLFWRYLNSSMVSFSSDILLPFPNSNDLNSCVATLSYSTISTLIKHLRVHNNLKGYVSSYNILKKSHKTCFFWYMQEYICIISLFKSLMSLFRNVHLACFKAILCVSREYDIILIYVAMKIYFWASPDFILYFKFIIPFMTHFLKIIKAKFENNLVNLSIISCCLYITL